MPRQDLIFYNIFIFYFWGVGRLRDCRLCGLQKVSKKSACKRAILSDHSITPQWCWVQKSTIEKEPQRQNEDVALDETVWIFKLRSVTHLPPSAAIQRQRPHLSIVKSIRSERDWPNQFVIWCSMMINIMFNILVFSLNFPNIITTW